MTRGTSCQERKARSNAVYTVAGFLHVVSGVKCREDVRLNSLYFKCRIMEKAGANQGGAGGELALVAGIPAAVKRHRQGSDAGQCRQGGLRSAVHLQEVLLQRLKVADAQLPAGHPQQ